MKWAQSCASVLKCYSFWSDRVDTLKWSRLSRKRLTSVTRLMNIGYIFHYEGTSLRPWPAEGVGTWKSPGWSWTGKYCWYCWSFSFYLSTLSGHALFNTHTDIDADTHAHWMLHNYPTTAHILFKGSFSKHKIWYESFILPPPSPSLLGRNGLVLSTKGAITLHNICRGKKSFQIFLLFCICSPGMHSSNNTSRTQIYLNLH